MILLEDSRQQVGKHDLKHKWFEEHGIEIRRTKLYAGDYCLPTNQKVCIDTKKDIQELVADVCSKQHERFRAECERAKEVGIKLIVLVENEGECLGYKKDIYNEPISDLKQLHSWKNPRLFIMKKTNKIIGYHKNGKPKFQVVQAYPNATRGTTLAKACYSMQQKYGVEFLFCKPEESGAKIIELLGGNNE